VKPIIKRFVRALGYDISRIDKVGVDPFADMKRLLVSPENSTIFGVDANVGQSTKRFRSRFPLAEIHSFEPSPAVFQILKQHVASDCYTDAWNCGLGTTNGSHALLENDDSVFSSFLPLSRQATDVWGGNVKKTSVEVQTIDRFCDDYCIGNIDILKVRHTGL
jgi:FkbM family methyltransferase